MTSTWAGLARGTRDGASASPRQWPGGHRGHTRTDAGQGEPP